MNNTFTNIILVVVLVLLVGFGVWYFTGREAPAQEENPGINIELRGGESGGSGSMNDGGY